MYDFDCKHEFSSHTILKTVKLNPVNSIVRAKNISVNNSSFKVTMEEDILLCGKAGDFHIWTLQIVKFPLLEYFEDVPHPRRHLADSANIA